MLELSTLCDVAEGELSALKADGLEPSWHDIVEINYLSHCVESPEGRVALCRGNPVFAGDVALWPMTLYATDWAGRTLDNKLFKLSERLQYLTYAYAMIHGREDMECSYWMLLPRLNKLYHSLKCNHAELVEVVNQVLNTGAEPEQPPQKETDNKRMSVGEFSAYLFATCGESPEFWERRCSYGYALDMLSVVAQQDRADGKSLKDDQKIKAERALGWALIKIRKRLKDNG